MEFAHRAFSAALACLSTFDVDDEYLEDLLQSTDDARMYLECLMTTYEASRGFTDENQPCSLELRCRRLIQRCHTLL